MSDQFQEELKALLKKYNKEIKVAINPIIVDAEKPKEVSVDDVIERMTKE